MTGSHPHHDHDHAHGGTHDHGHTHGHGHGHGHASTELDETTAAAVDTSVPDRELSPSQLSRRTMLRAAGIVGGVAAAGLGSAAPGGRQGPVGRRPEPRPGPPGPRVARR